MGYRIAGIDVHKRTFAVVVSDVEVHDGYHFERRHFRSNPAQLRNDTPQDVQCENHAPLFESVGTGPAHGRLFQAGKISSSTVCRLIWVPVDRFAATPRANCPNHSRISDLYLSSSIR